MYSFNHRNINTWNRDDIFSVEETNSVSSGMQTTDAPVQWHLPHDSHVACAYVKQTHGIRHLCWQGDMEWFIPQTIQLMGFVIRPFDMQKLYSSKVEINLVPSRPAIGQRGLFTFRQPIASLLGTRFLPWTNTTRKALLHPDVLKCNSIDEGFVMISVHGYTIIVAIHGYTKLYTAKVLIYIIYLYIDCKTLLHRKAIIFINIPTNIIIYYLKNSQTSNQFSIFFANIQTLIKIFST